MVLNRDDVVRRARSMTEPGYKIVYKLGMGGTRPGDAMPGQYCDCSGFIAWCYGISRKLDHPWYKETNGGWLETTAVVRDALSTNGMFDEVPRDQALPGDVIVYGDRGGYHGHIALVATVDKNGPKTVVHCSKGNYSKYGHAVAETDAGFFFTRPSVVARASWLEFRKS